ncbi:cystathionine beta-synthase, partial [Shewanella sp. GutCb]
MKRLLFLIVMAVSISPLVYADAIRWNQLTGEQLEQQLTEKFAQGKYSNKGAD